MYNFLLTKAHSLSNHYGLSDRESYVNADKPVKKILKMFMT